jgi:nucleotide-binding universal stress UspA family protein
MSRIRRILHPTDFSKASSAAYKRAVDMAKGNRAELLLVHVLTPAVPVMAIAICRPMTAAAATMSLSLDEAAWHGPLSLRRG